MNWFGIGESVLGMVDGILDKVIPDAAEREKAKLEMRRLNQTGELKELETRMSAILAEANSTDPWTSRARPSFLYLCYFLIGFAVPMGFVSAFSPETSTAVITGFKAWLDAIPSDLYTLMGIGYLGYSGARSWDKRNKVSK